MQTISTFIKAAMLILVLAVISCTKQPDSFLQPTSSEITVETARAWFNKHSLAQSRAREKSSRFSDLLPLWGSAVKSQTGSGVSYIEIPLQPSKNLKRVYDKSGFVSEMELSLVIYIENGQTKETVKEILPNLTYARSHNNKISKSDFEGKVLIWSWTGDLLGGSFYEGGKRVGVIKPISSIKNGRASGQYCTVYTTCYWSAYCFDGLGSFTFYGTSSTSIDSECPYPGYGHGSSDDNSCSSWELVDTDSYQQCYDTGGDPTPGEGTTPGSGGQSPPNTYYPDYNKDISCTSFVFTQTASNWQEAGVKGFYMIIAYLDGTGRGSQRFDIPGQIVIGLPLTRANGDPISSGRAAKIAAAVVDMAGDLTFNSYRNLQGTPMGTDIERSFRQNLQIAGQALNANVSTNGSGHPNILIKQSEFTFWGTGNCDN